MQLSECQCSVIIASLFHSESLFDTDLLSDPCHQEPKIRTQTTDKVLWETKSMKLQQKTFQKASEVQQTEASILRLHGRLGYLSLVVHSKS